MSCNNKPFIKKFEFNKKFYIYDVNTNSFFNVDEPVYTLIDRNGSLDKSNFLEKYPKRKIEEAQKNIDAMMEKGYFSSNRPQITYFHTIARDNFPEFLKEILTRKLHKITMVVSEDCNMRCRYCAYSGKYFYNRKHSKNLMDIETMRKAVDFYFSHSIENPEKYLSFYGGEPLLNFQLIKECINYVKDRYSTTANYIMTTNGSLLKKEVVNFLVENNFTILVSLDGSEDIQNKYRVFKNGKGTFDCVMKNLKAMKEMHPEYYAQKVRFSIVLTPDLDFEQLNEFISNPDIEPSGVSISYVNDRFTTFFDQFSEEKIKTFYEKRRKNRDAFFRKIIEGEELNYIEKNMFRKKFFSLHRRSMEKLSSKFPSNGQCMLGERALLVKADGSFNFCTRVDDAFNLGNIESGYDYTRIEQIYSDMDKLFEERCAGCWAIRLCMKCINDVNKNGEVDRESFETFCSARKQAILSEMKDYIKIRESNYHALDYLEEVTVI